MKKWIVLALITAMMTALLCCAATAEIVDSGTCGDNLTWTLDSDGLLTISGTGDMADYAFGTSPWQSNRSIQTILMEEGVTGVGGWAFFTCDNVTNVTLPAGVTRIGESAFAYCGSLTDIMIPESVTSIGSRAFSGSGVTYVSIPAGVTSLGEAAFEKCSGLSFVDIGPGLTHIGEFAFSDCPNLTGVDMLYANVTHIDAGAFSYCTGLTEAWLPASVTHIGEAAYAGSGLTQITISSGVTSIGEDAFNGCGNLMNIFVEEENTSYASVNGTLYNADRTLLLQFPGKRTGITIPAGVTEIGARAFESSRITSLTIPDSMTNIREGAFYNCTALTDVYYTGTADQWNAVSIGSDNECLTGAALHCGHTPGPAIVGSGACGDNLTWTLDENGLLTISGIGAMTDYDSWENFAPWNEKNVVTVQIDNGVTYIGNSAFFDCDSLTGVAIPASVTGIGDYAFCSCNNLASITLPAGVTSIGEEAFNWCSSLTGVTIPASVTHIGDYAFAACGSLTDISVASGNTAYSSANGVLYNKAKTVLLQWPAGKTSVSIPTGVTGIGDGAFAYCKNVTGVTIPAGVTSIGSNAFVYCTGLTSVSIPSGVETIEAGAFCGCSSLTGIELPAGLTSIEDDMFRECGSLASVTIPAGATSIGGTAFQECSRLASVTIPRSVTSIGNWAFQECTSLTDVYYGGTEAEWNAVSIGEDNDPLLNATIHFTGPAIVDSGTCGTNVTWTLDENGLLTISGTGAMADYSDDTPAPWNEKNVVTVQIENGVTSIGDHAFRSCKNLASITIPTGVTSIGEYAFSWCSSLTGITLPAGVTSIGKDAFIWCTSLTGVTIPAGVTHIGDYAFAGCRSLTGISVASGNTAYSSANGVLYNKAQTVLLQWPAGKTSVSIPAGVTRIGNGAFLGCMMTSVTIPEGVTYIGNLAFLDCNSLTSIVILEGVTGLGEYTFVDCGSLASVSIPASYAEDFDSWIFDGCESLTNITVAEGSSRYSSLNGVLYNKDRTELVYCPNGLSGAFEIPSGVTSVVSGAFARSFYLTSIVIPESMTSIDDYAFCNCDSLTSITIPKSVTGIGSGVFSEYADLTDVYFGGTEAEWNAVSIGEDNAPLLNATIHFSGPAIVDSGACGDNLTWTLDENGLLTISGTGAMTDYDSWENFAPWNEKNVVTVQIDDGVTHIGNFAFNWCSSLTDVTIPAGVTSIGENAFSSTGLTGVTIPAGVTGIGDGAFGGCRSLTGISVANGNTAYSSADGVLYNAAQTVLLQWPAGKAGASIPSGVTRIGSSAFFRCVNVTSVTIPAGVTSIGDGAFSNCENLTSIELPSGLTSIGDYAFMTCTSLTGVTIPSTVTSIGDYAFCETAMTSIVIPEGVARLGYGALSLNENLTSVTFPSTLTRIEGDTFLDSSNLTDVTIPEGVISIGESAFVACSKLTVIELPSGMTSLGFGAFSNCTGMTAVTIPKSMTSIDEAAFNQCTSLADVYYGGTEAEWNAISIGESNDPLLNATIHFAGPAIVDSGNCGDNLTWTLDENGLLTISGTGAMADYSDETPAPWNEKNVVTVQIGDGVTSIGVCAFTACSGLTSVTIPAGATSIGDEAFSWCESLSSITLPAGVTSIGKDAFSNSGLTSITIPAGVTGIGEDAFFRCSSLTDIIVAAENPAYASEDGVLYNKSKTVLLLCPAKKADVTIPASVTAIADSAFSENSVLESITIPSGVNTIGHWAFSYCSNLTTVTIQPGLSSIEDFAFYGGSNLRSVTIPVSVTRINDYTGGSILSPSGDCVFDGCENITLYVERDSIAHMYAVKEEINYQIIECEHIWGETEYVWTEDNSAVTATRVCTKNAWHVETETVNAVKRIVSPTQENAGAVVYTAEFTNEAFETQEKSTAIPALGTLSVLRLPSGLETIEDEAFMNLACEAVIIPDSCTSIGQKAFADCTHLVYVYIPAGVSTIETDAFDNCPNAVIDRAE